MEQNQDNELLNRIAAGDHLAFTDLVDTYQHNLGVFIYNITKSKELAEEITLHVFLKIWMTAKPSQPELKELLLSTLNSKATAGSTVTK